MSSRSRNLYTGVTNNLHRRAWEHKNHLIEGFTARYNIDRLVYFENFVTIMATIAREKEIKAWRREKRVRLIEGMNPSWADLAEDWYR